MLSPTLSVLEGSLTSQQDYGCKLEFKEVKRKISNLDVFNNKMSGI